MKRESSSATWDELRPRDCDEILSEHLHLTIFRYSKFKFRLIQCFANLWMQYIQLRSSCILQVICCLLRTLNDRFCDFSLFESDCSSTQHHVCQHIRDSISLHWSSLLSINDLFSATVWSLLQFILICLRRKQSANYLSDICHSIRLDCKTLLRCTTRVHEINDFDFLKFWPEIFVISLDSLNLLE